MCQFRSVRAFATTEFNASFSGRQPFNVSGCLQFLKWFVFSQYIENCYVAADCTYT